MKKKLLNNSNELLRAVDNYYSDLRLWWDLGTDSWDRQRISRKLNRRLEGIERLPPLEREALLSRLKEKYF